MAAVGASHRSPQSKAPLGKIQPIAGLPPHAIVPNPLDVRLVHTSLIDQVLDQPANGILRQCSHHSSIQTEAPLEAAGNVVFTAAFPHFEFSCMRDPVFSGVKAKHYLSQSNKVPAALRLVFKLKTVHGSLSSANQYYTAS